MPITRDAYINAPSPLRRELLAIFEKTDSLIIFDIGSCEGEDSIKYSRLFPSSQIYAIEALPSNIELLESNLKKYAISNVEIVPFALSDKKGIVNFHVSSGQPKEKKESQDWNYGNKSSSLLPPDKNLTMFPWLKFEDVINVESTTLYDVCCEKSISHIDFVHMDVQGAELQVLYGAKDLIKKIKVVWLEVESIALYKNQPLKQDIESFMHQHGFTKLKDTVGNVSGDQLYINTNYLSKKSISQKLFLKKISFITNFFFNKFPYFIFNL